MSRLLLPKYKCEAIAREVNQLLRVTPPVTWRQVQRFAEPQIPGLEGPGLATHPPDVRRRIARAIMREIRYLHTWT